MGIVVDQMRYDYLSRFWNRFGEGGFKRFVNNGFNCKNNHYNYAPTSTGPGHASIYTGTTPSTHGIIGNNWYDKELQRARYTVREMKLYTNPLELPQKRERCHLNRMVGNYYDRSITPAQPNAIESDIHCS